MSAPQLPPGTVVAQKYQLGACLGYAGSSATYQAVSSDGREVVLKIFDPGIRQRADIMGAIEQTYAATNALPQDVAVPLLDAGYDAATGAPFSVGERIPFPSMAQLVAQRPLGPDEVANVLGVLAHLLDQAHARQLFHHALKPTNVFFGLGQRNGLRVTDFGAGLVRTAVPTQEGYALAAPWLAPEQVQGQVPAGAAADVFAIGLMMFFAMTGRSYWRSCQGPLDLAGWQREVMSPRTPPSARALQLGVTLSSAFDGILGCALSPDPGQRYRSVRELGQAFEALAGAKAPESQATMAFPAGAVGFNPHAGDYPPPPAPTGGYQAAPGPAAGGQGQIRPGQPQGNTTLSSPYVAQPQPPQQQPQGTAQYPWGGQQQEALQQQAYAQHAAQQAAQQQQQAPGRRGGQPRLRLDAARLAWRRPVPEPGGDVGRAYHLSRRRPAPRLAEPAGARAGGAGGGAPARGRRGGLGAHGQALAERRRPGCGRVGERRDHRGRGAGPTSAAAPVATASAAAAVGPRRRRPRQTRDRRPRQTPAPRPPTWTRAPQGWTRPWRATPSATRSSSTTRPSSWASR